MSLDGPGVSPDCWAGPGPVYSILRKVREGFLGDGHDGCLGLFFRNSDFPKNVQGHGDISTEQRASQNGSSMVGNPVFAPNFNGHSIAGLGYLPTSSKSLYISINSKY